MFGCSHIGRAQVGGWLKPDHVKLIVEDRGRYRPHGLGGDIVTLEGIRHIAVVYSEFDQADVYHKIKKESRLEGRDHASSKTRRPK